MLHPETDRNPVSLGGRGKVEFATDTQRVTGDDRRRTNEHLSRAEALGPDIHAVVGTSLDKGVELDEGHGCGIGTRLSNARKAAKWSAPGFKPIPSLANSTDPHCIECRLEAASRSPMRGENQMGQINQMAKVTILLQEIEGQLRLELHGFEDAYLLAEASSALSEINSAINSGDARVIYQLWLKIYLLLIRVKSMRLAALYDGPEDHLDLRDLDTVLQQRLPEWQESPAVTQGNPPKPGR